MKKYFPYFLLTIIFACFCTKLIGKSPQSHQYLKLWENKSLPIEKRLSNLDTLIHKYYLHSNPDTVVLLLEILKDTSEINNLFSNFELSYHNSKALLYHFYYSDSEKSINEAEHYMKRAQSKNNMKHFAYAMNILGINYFSMGEYDKAIDYYSKQIDIQEQEGTNLNGLCRSYVNIGLVYEDLDSLITAFDYYLKGIEIAEVQDYKYGQIISKGGLARTYNKLNDFDKSLEIFEEILSLSLETDNMERVAATYVEIGSLYFSLEKYSLAIQHYEYAESYLGKLKDKKRKGKVNIFLGKNYLKLNEIDSSESKLQKAIELTKDIKKYRYLKEIYLLKGLIDLSKKKYESAISNFKTANLLNKDDKDVKFASKVNLNLSNTYAKINNELESLRSYKKHSQFEKTVRSEKETKSLLRSEMKYKFDIEKKIIENEKLVTQNKYEKQTSRLTLLVVITTLLSLILGLLYYLYYRNLKLTNKIQKKNEIIAEKNLSLKEINSGLILKNNLIKQQEKEKEKLILELKKSQFNIKKQNQLLIESNHNLSNFASIAAHDIKAPLRTISSFTEILARKYKTAYSKEDLDLVSLITNGCKDLSEIIEGLLNFSSLTRNLSPAKTVDMKKMVNAVSIKLYTSMNEHNATISNPDDLPDTFGHYNLIQQVLLNLINNSIKFGKKDKANRIDINYKILENGYVQFSIKDEGIGIPKEQQTKVFELFTKYHETKKHSGHGIGLATCRKIIQFYGGRIWIESELGAGTTLFFTLKKAQTRAQIKTTREME